MGLVMRKAWLKINSVFQFHLSVLDVHIRNSVNLCQYHHNPNVLIKMLKGRVESKMLMVRCLAGTSLKVNVKAQMLGKHNVQNKI